MKGPSSVLQMEACVSPPGNASPYVVVVVVVVFFINGKSKTGSILMALDRHGKSNSVSKKERERERGGRSRGGRESTKH